MPSNACWNTDTASTAVNKIQAGNLDVALEMYENGEWVSAEGKTLNFVAKDGRTDILWEPGSEYLLPKLRIRNNGNLAAKYNVVITGMNGDAKLNEVIDWKVGFPRTSISGAYTDWRSMGQGCSTFFTDKVFAPANTTTITAGADFWNPIEFTIKGTMSTKAGNEYQGLSIDGIAITVVATQASYENDSNGRDYDANATYPAYTPAITVPQSGNLTLETNDTNPVKLTLPVAALTSNTTTAPTSVSLKYDGIIENSAANTVTFTALEIVDQNGKVVNLSNNTTHLITVTLPVKNIADGTKVKVYHDGQLVTIAKVQDHKITYDVHHLCDVTVEPIETGEIASSSTNDTRTGTTYSSSATLSNKKVTHTFNNTKRDCTAIYIKGNETNVTFDNVDLSLKQTTRVVDTQVKRNLAIYVYGASLTINSGTYNVDGLDTYFLWLQDSTVTINGGTFTSNSQGAMLASYSKNSELIINGGFFDQSAGNENLTLQGGVKSGKGKIVVKGGTFVEYNPQEHVADGYKVVNERQNNGKVYYKVVAAN